MKNHNVESAGHFVEENFRNLLSSGFPSLTTLASYAPLSQKITVMSFGAEDVEKFRQAQEFHLGRRIYPTVVHELTHWLDHVSTLAGQENLVYAYNAINARMDLEDTSSYWRIAQYRSKCSRFQSPQYFHEMTPAVHESWDWKEWQRKVTLGVEFNWDGRPCEERPLILVRFSTNDGRFLCRVPLSFESLTETTAKCAEMSWEEYLMDRFSEEIDVPKQFKRYFEKYVSDIYQPKMAVYCAAAHCVATELHMDDFRSVYPLAAAIAKLAMNLPSSVFSLLDLPREVSSVNAKTHEHRVEALRKLRDRGFAFLSILLSTDAGDVSDPKKCLERALARAGLPNFSEMKELCLQEMNDLEQKIFEGPASARLRKILEVGRSNFSTLGVVGILEDCDRILEGRTRLQYPLVECSDGRCWKISNNCWESVADWNAWNMLLEGIKNGVGLERGFAVLVHEFLEACQGMDLEL